MATLREIGRRPAGAAAEGQFGRWFAALAAHLLNATDFLVAGRPYRLAEVEAYYSGPGHPDPFTHKDPLQREFGRWYFHRTAGEYRGGSFKGVDLTFGDGRGTFGVLVRSVVAPDGALIDGPSLTVDHLLRQTGAASVAGLDRAIAGRPWWDTSSPLAVRESGEPRAAEVVTTARVGLSLRRGRGRPDAPRFVMRPYRYLTEPRRITKGKPQTVLALHAAGKDVAAIQAMTGVARRVIDKYVADFAVGECEPGFEAYTGKELSTADLCKLIGTWAAHFGRPPV
jgi:hypothetical protein